MSPSRERNPCRLMSEPFIGADGYYAVHVMWLDPITADQNKDSFTARYMDNKRDASVHPKGWDPQWVSSLDHTCAMIASGHYVKLAAAEKRLIETRQRSWELAAQEAGVPRPKDKLRVGVHRKRPRQ